jgi:C4-dicarboxylate-specific signal transduction histidine kinase
MIRRDGVARWPVLLGVLLLSGALATMLWLRGRLVEAQAQELMRAVRLFETTDVLGRPESPAITFADVEANVRASEGSFIRRLVVTKVLADGREVIVHPFHLELTDPQWREADWKRLPVAEPPVGFLYLQADPTTLHFANGVVALLGVVLSVGLGTLLLRQRGKEQQLVRAMGELEEKKDQVVQLERLALVGQLSANVFHDIKKPVLNIKHEVTDLLEAAGDSGERAALDPAVLRGIAQQTELFLQMLRDLGIESFASTRQAEREWCDLWEAVDRSLRLVRYEQEGVTVDVDFERGEEFLLHAIPHRLVQLVSNLALNSFQAMDGRGRLLIRARKEANGGRLRLSVEDSGPGIPHALRDALFTPFATTNGASGGSGLGLYISRTIVEDLGGTIRAEGSKELGGAAFIMEFPAGEAPTPKATADPPAR